MKLRSELARGYSCTPSRERGSMMPGPPPFGAARYGSHYERLSASSISPFTARRSARTRPYQPSRTCVRSDQSGIEPRRRGSDGRIRQLQLVGFTQSDREILDLIRELNELAVGQEILGGLGRMCTRPCHAQQFHTSYHGHIHDRSLYQYCSTFIASKNINDHAGVEHQIIPTHP